MLLKFLSWELSWLCRSSWLEVWMTFKVLNQFPGKWKRVQSGQLNRDVTWWRSQEAVESLLMSASLPQHLDCCPPFWRHSVPGTYCAGAWLPQQTCYFHAAAWEAQQLPPSWWRDMSVWPSFPKPCLWVWPVSTPQLRVMEESRSPPLSHRFVCSTSFTLGNFWGQEAADDKTLPQKFRQPFLFFP